MRSFDLVESCRRDLEEAGFSVAAVTGDVTGCDWAYTVGLDLTLGHPELVVVGLPAPLAGGVVEILAQLVRSGERLEAGQELQLGPLRLRIVDVDEVFCAHGDWFNLGREVMAAWGRRWPRTLQVLWADAAGGFPDDDADGAGWGLRQPVLARGR